MTPFSNNIIFWDSEFSSLDPRQGEILSVGMVKFSGEEFYIELEYEGYMDEWPKENVLPFLGDKKIQRSEAGKMIYDFIGEGKPYLMSYVNQYDTLYLYKLLGLKGGKDYKFNWISLDFASILFGIGIDPEEFSFGSDFCKKLGIDYTQYRHHHALDDAKLLRDVYLRLNKE
ncbi:MAG: hypothetical protein PHW33_05395 [Candidatus Portnoybacteria bacterium]|nr:hypothetical protein [Candidatus Portnoybacteria bacterium]MDD5589788.1 hypothetical protein [Candidatus Portnoybacteria bacterium]